MLYIPSLFYQFMSSSLDPALTWRDEVDINVVRAGVNELLLTQQLPESTTHMFSWMLPKITELT